MKNSEATQAGSETISPLLDELLQESSARFLSTNDEQPLGLIKQKDAVSTAVASKDSVTRMEPRTRFSAPVSYVLPSMERLQKRFAFVSPICADTRIKPIEMCRRVSCAHRDVAFDYFCAPHQASFDELMRGMIGERLRPALFQELIAFDVKYPREMRKFPIVALGSLACTGRDRFVACLQYSLKGGRQLLLRDAGYRWFRNYRFLVAPMDPALPKL